MAVDPHLAGTKQLLQAAMAEAGDVASVALGGVALKQEAIGAAARQTAASLEQVAGALKRQTPEQASPLGPAATNTAAYRAQIPNDRAPDAGVTSARGR